MKKIIYATYAPDSDITFIMCETIEGENAKSIEVIGWYWGEPNSESTEAFIGNLKAEF